MMNSEPRVRGATDVLCGAGFLKFTVRTQRPMEGVMYAHGHHDDLNCALLADGQQSELTLTFREGTCGLRRLSVSAGGQVNRAQAAGGFSYNLTVVLQFHPLIVTRADQGLDVSCFVAAPGVQPAAEPPRALGETQCSYRLHRFGPNECSALDAKVGETLFHKWQCDLRECPRPLPTPLSTQPPVPGARLLRQVRAALGAHPRLGRVSAAAAEPHPPAGVRWTRTSWRRPTTRLRA